MYAVRYLYRNVNLLNLSLLALIAATIMFAILPLFRMTMKFSLPSVKARAVAEEQVAATTPLTPPSPLDYVIVGEQNLFHPERRIPPEKKEEKALPRPELVLYGTVIHGDGAQAYIEDIKSPKTSPGRGNRHQVIRKGDVLSGFALREIEADKIVLARGDEVMVVYLSSDGKRKGEPSRGAPQPAKGATQPVASGTAGFTHVQASAPAQGGPIVRTQEPPPMRSPGRTSTLWNRMAVTTPQAGQPNVPAPRAN
jgi:hypothetical protein